MTSVATSSVTSCDYLEAPSHRLAEHGVAHLGVWIRSSQFLLGEFTAKRGGHLKVFPCVLGQIVGERLIFSGSFMGRRGRQACLDHGSLRVRLDG